MSGHHCILSNHDMLISQNVPEANLSMHISAYLPLLVITTLILIYFLQETTQLTRFGCRESHCLESRHSTPATAFVLSHFRFLFRVSVWI